MSVKALNEITFIKKLTNEQRMNLVKAFYSNEELSFDELMEQLNDRVSNKNNDNSHELYDWNTKDFSTKYTYFKDNDSFTYFYFYTLPSRKEGDFLSILFDRIPEIINESMIFIFLQHFTKESSLELQDDRVIYDIEDEERNRAIELW